MVTVETNARDDHYTVRSLIRAKIEGMSYRRVQTVPAFVPQALSASQVGVWETNFGNDCTIGDAATAALFGVSPALAADGLPFSTWVQGIHPDDRRSFDQRIGPLREQGGMFVFEYRTCPSPGVIRWVLARGRYERDQRTRNIVGRGIVIDITDSKLDGHVEDRALFVSPVENESPLDRLAAHALEARQAIDEIDAPMRPALRQAADALLWIIGRALARKHTN